MGDSIAKVVEGHAQLAPRTFDDVLRFAEMLAKSDLVPKDYKGRPGNIVAAVQMGAEIGLSPMQALANIAVINGRAAVWGDAMLALVQGHPDCEDVVEVVSPDSKVATCTVMRKGRSPVVRTFSLDDARQAQLLGKQGPWTQYTKRMLQMRARAFALRDSFADVLRGIGMAEEVQDIPVRETKVTVRDERPTAPPPPALPAHNAETGEVFEAPADIVIPYGQYKGKRVSDDSIPGGYLREYLEPRLAKAVADPSKARFLRDNLALLEAVRVEVLRRDALRPAYNPDADDDFPDEGAAEAEAEVMHGATDE